MKSFRVLSASINPTTGFIEIVKEITADDNSTSLNLHTFHPETLEWKAAELGLSDPDEIIDGILHEPFFGLDVLALQKEVADARALFRTQLADAKARLTNPLPRNPVAIKTLLGNAGVAQRYIDAVDINPTQAIRSACPFDAEVIAAKQLHTNKVRSVAIKEQKAKGLQVPLTPGERAARLRELQRSLLNNEGRRPEVPVEETSLSPIILDGKRKKQQ